MGEKKNANAPSDQTHAYSHLCFVHKLYVIPVHDSCGHMGKDPP